MWLLIVGVGSLIYSKVLICEDEQWPLKRNRLLIMTGTRVVSNACRPRTLYYQVENVFGARRYHSS